MLNTGRQSMEGLVDVFSDIEMKGKSQHETLDNLIKQTLGTDSFLSFGDADKSSVHRFPWSDTIDQKNMNQHLDTRGRRQEAFENSIIKNSLQSNVKGNNVFGKGSQSLGDRFNSFKIPEAVVAIVQATKGWPLLSNKMAMHKCDKCSQEFCSPLNLRRHMRATHRRPLSGDKEDLKKNKEQIAAYWNKLTSEEARQILSSDNLSVTDLSATLLVQALSAQIQKPGLTSPPQSYVRAATGLLDLVQSKSSRFPISFNELYAILDDASEKNTFYGVTSSSMQRHIFDGEPAKVGLEAKNLVASLGFLVELRLVKVWTEDKDVEALKCQQALVEEEEAALKKRVKLQERKRQKKMRQKESKEKERKTAESASGVQGKLDSSLDDSSSTSPSQSSPSLSCFSDTIVSSKRLSENIEGINFSDASGRMNEDELFHHAYESADIDGQTGFCNEQVDSKRMMYCARTGGLGWKEKKCDGTRLSNFSKQVYGNDKRYFDNKYGHQRLLRKEHNSLISTAHEFTSFSPRYVHHREQSSSMKSTTLGSGHAVWARKISKTKDPISHGVDVGSGSSAILNDVSGGISSLDLHHLQEGSDICPIHSEKPGMLSQDSSISLESINSNSSASISARVGIEEQDYSESACSSLMSATEGHGALLIGSVMIPYAGDQSNGSSCEESEWNDALGLGRDCAHVECFDDFSTKDSVISTAFPTISSVDGASLTIRKNSSHNQLSFLCEGSTQVKMQEQNVKSGSVKVWRPVTPAGKVSACNGISSSETGIVEDCCLINVDCFQSNNQCSGDMGKNELMSDISCCDETSYKAVHAPDVTASDDRKHPVVGAKNSSLPSSYLDISNLLCQRWVEATSSSDVVFHCDLDDACSYVSSVV